jgi:hypothetical protein
VFTFEWLGRPSESGIPKILNRSMTSQTSPKAAIAHAKELLKSQTTLPTGTPYGVRVLNNDSVLVWTGNIDDT